jgi:Leucine rich repeat/Leucine Rich repeat
MTLINSCWPNSFSHLIILLSTFTITISQQQNHSYDQRESRQQAAGVPGNGHDREIDNKRYDNLFDFKTDVNKLLFHSHGNLMPFRRHRRDVSASNLILNLSCANLTNLANVNVNESVAALNLSHNLLTSLDDNDDGRKFQNLTLLDVSHNRFSKLLLREHRMLEALDVSHNVLATFNCSNCEYLRVLNLSHNALTSVTLENFSNLDVVDLSDNLLSALNTHLFHENSNLSVAILACNQINAINKDLFIQLRNLRRLDLSHNDISDIENDAFDEMLNLQILDLSFNRIHIAALQTLQNIPQLARLSIAGNVMLRNALRAFAVTWSIMELDYSHVGLCQVPDSLAQSVRILNLYGNFLNVSISFRV